MKYGSGELTEKVVEVFEHALENNDQEGEDKANEEMAESVSNSDTIIKETETGSEVSDFKGPD